MSLSEIYNKGMISHTILRNSKKVNLLLSVKCMYTDYVFLYNIHIELIIFIFDWK